MNKRNISLSIILIIITAATFFTGCSPKGFQSSSASTAPDQTNTSTGTGDSGSSGGTTNPGTQPIDTVDLKGKVDDTASSLGIHGVLTFDFDKTKAKFIIMVPMPSGMIFTPSGSFKNYPDITYGPIFDATGKMKMAIRIPIRYVIKGLTIGNPAKLPSGEDLPAMPAGKNELPSLALQFPLNDNIQMNLYIGINAIGFFMSLPNQASLPLPFNITLPIKNKDKTMTMGYLTYVTAKNGFDSGIFVSSIIPPNVSRILEDYFHL